MCPMLHEWFPAAEMSRDVQRCPEHIAACSAFNVTGAVRAKELVHVDPEKP